MRFKSFANISRVACDIHPVTDGEIDAYWESLADAGTPLTTEELVKLKESRQQFKDGDFITETPLSLRDRNRDGTA